jgi:hypothetical protein
MALSARQIRVLNDLSKYEPALRKGALPAADQILLGDLLNQIQMPALVSAAATAVSGAALTGATYGATEETRINNLQTTVNALVALVNEMRTNINAHAA